MLSQKIYQETLKDLERINSAEEVESIREIYHTHFEEIRNAHNKERKGLIISRALSSLVDAILLHLYNRSIRLHPESRNNLSLIALGGYGRGYLNPYSDVDLLFLTNEASDALPPCITLAIESILYPLWDLGFKVGHASRNIAECLSESFCDTRTLTSLLEARLIAGSNDSFTRLNKDFRNKVVDNRKNEYLDSRMKDLGRRHKKYSHTTFLQEPNVKESPGGLRDFHNIIWTTNVTLGCRSLDDIVAKKIMTAGEASFLLEAVDFLHWVRNELHFRTGRCSDILTLQLQGIIATPRVYPHKSILRRTEAFMKDYYSRARGISDQLLSILEQLNLIARQKENYSSLLPVQHEEEEQWHSFLIKDGLLYVQDSDIYDNDPALLMRTFQICQMRGLDLSPDLRTLIQKKITLVDNAFRRAPSIAETFQSILERKGDVARILRIMHRVGFLGAWMPEFGAMDCLVQHEFFHRYTADEHTLRCIEQLDSLFAKKDSFEHKSENRDLFRRIFLDISDPYALYLSLLLHDSGRAENMREHTDGSAMLASQVCTRLGIVGSRRKTIMFLVDHHLTFWRYATTRNIDDPEVIGEFARSIKNQSNLEFLYLFTYVDSMGTNEDSWSSWRDSLMNQLFRKTSRYFEEGNPQAFKDYVDSETERVKKKALKAMGAKGEEANTILAHFNMLPKRYFRFRKTESVIAHLETMEKFRKESTANPEVRSVLLWRDYRDKGYTELVISARNQPFFIEKLCCALAYQQINILSAEIFTRSDGLILDILRICTVRHEPVTNRATQIKVEEVFHEILPLQNYHPEKYLLKRQNFLTKPQEGLPFPVQAWVRNDISPDFTIIEIQAIDRIGLLHDIFHCIGSLGLQTINARISTEKGAALDTLYVTDSSGQKINNPDTLSTLEQKLNALIA